MPSRIKPSPVQRIIARCGGLSRVQKATGAKLRAIQTWATNGCPPAKWWPVLVRLADDLTYEELDRLWKGSTGRQILTNLEGIE